MSDVTIRLFEPADLPDLIALERMVYGSGAYSYYFFRQLYDLFPRLVWVAEHRSAGRQAVVGHVCGAISQDGSTGWILNLAVQAHWRSQGVGSRLIHCCLEHLQEGGAQVARITLHPENDAGVAMLRKNGFAQTGVEENYYGDGTERLIFEKTF